MRQLKGREEFGVAFRAFAHCRNGVFRFFDALSNGQIEALATSPPPSTGHALLDAAGLPDAGWWMKYSRATFEAVGARGIELPLLWSEWFHTEIVVQTESTMQLLEGILDGERASFGEEASFTPTSTWSDIEALAWVVSRDERLRKNVRDFARHAGPGSKKWRERGLLYLAFHVASRHCTCTARSSPIRAIVTPNVCTCLKAAWESLIGALQRGDLSAELRGMKRTVPIRSNRFRAGTYSTREREFCLIGGSGDVLLDGEEIVAKFQSGSSEPFDDDQIQDFITNCGTNNSKEAWRRFNESPRAKGRYKRFIFYWNQLRKNPQGRPRKNR